MKKYEYASRTVFCKTQEDVDEVLNNEIYKFNKVEDVIFLNITPYINTSVTGIIVPICYYVSYVYRWEK